MLIVDRACSTELFPMADAIAVMRDAFEAWGAGRVHQPIRTVVQPPTLDGLSVIMPGNVDGHGFGMKIVNVFGGNHAVGLEPVQGCVLLFDHSTGVPLAILDAASITEIRTAAVSGVATDLLARADAGDLAIIGAGVQAGSHLQAMREVRDLRRIRVWNRTPDRARQLAAASDLDVQVCETVAAATDGADIICTTTSSPDPVLLSRQVSDGAHVNAVGAFSQSTREVDSELVARARVWVDSREAALAEAGDVLIPISEGVKSDAQLFELSDLVAGGEGRTAARDVTLFKSLGLAMEDVVAAAHIYRRAVTQGRGTAVGFP